LLLLCKRKDEKEPSPYILNHA